MWWTEFCNFLGSIFGLTNEASPEYAFWSGVGSDIGELTLISGAVVFYQHHTCHVQHCWRLAKHAHDQDGATYMVCRKHHPTADKIRAEDIREKAS